MIDEGMPYEQRCGMTRLSIVPRHLNTVSINGVSPASLNAIRRGLRAVSLTGYVAFCGHRNLHQRPSFLWYQLQRRGCQRLLATPAEIEGEKSTRLVRARQECIRPLGSP